ncbi:4-hydroxybenzoyl-CoA thioesterase (plasmid) [Alcanivorax sp. N3-2A]|nr:4-hydroxybenzoyl-CoA thioesterase [Alcanivorax sp. N3-2A]ASK36779.1 4-hydroxybenzoyl-CoA thioesterase [Alcanivorax sp. N3-2A]|tara:strand:- start:31548 stop:31976 length:429 start_codon:yes stop_codon:yes gene_type:complete
MNESSEARLRHSVEVEIPFHDVDMMEVVWHGHYLKYCELARCALLERFDYNYPQMRASGYLWPIIDVRLRYAHPARFGERITVTATVREWHQRLKISYQIHNAHGQRLARGHSVQVAVEIASGEMLYRSPPVLLDRLGVKPL